MVAFLTETALSTYNPLNGNGQPRGANMAQAWRYHTGIEKLLESGSISERVFSLKTTLQSWLSPEAGTAALVVGDPTPGNDGLYQRTDSAPGGWLQMTSSVPGLQIVRATDVGAGTPNALQATTDIGLSLVAGQLVLLTVFETNTSTPVTIRFNGTGTTYAIKTRSGNDPPAGGITAGPVLGYIDGSFFRLVTDTVSTAIQAAAEAAAVIAVDAKEDAEDALASAQSLVVGLSPASFRERLSATKQLYVRTDGNDANSGLVDSSGGAKLTIQAAITAAYRLYDPSQQEIVINVGNGTYAAGAIFFGKLPWGGRVRLVANATAESVIINSGAACIDADAGADVIVEGGFRLNATTFGIIARRSANVLFSGVRFGACAVHIWATDGGRVEAIGNYDIIGSAQQHVQVSHGGRFRRSSGVATLRANITVTDFLYALDYSSIVITGPGYDTAAGAGVYDLNGFTVTGRKHQADAALIQWPSAGYGWIPGTVYGIERAGGRFRRFPTSDKGFATGSSSINLATVTGSLFYNNLEWCPGRVRFWVMLGAAANWSEGEAIIDSAGVVTQWSQVTIAGNRYAYTDRAGEYAVDVSNYWQFSFVGRFQDGFEITASKTGSPTGTAHLRWAAEAN